MLVAEKEHERDRIVEFVHLFEIGHLIEVANVEDGEVFDSVGDSWRLLAILLKTGRRFDIFAEDGDTYCKGPHPGACSRHPSLDQSGSRLGALLRT